MGGNRRKQSSHIRDSRDQSFDTARGEIWRFSLLRVPLCVSNFRLHYNINKVRTQEGNADDKLPDVGLFAFDVEIF